MDIKMDVAFKNAKVFDIRDRIDVVKGEVFTLFTDMQQPARWFTDNDPVLGVTAQGTYAEISADNIGPSTLLILDAANGLIKQLTVNVVASIQEPAVNLGTNAGSPVNK